MPCLVHRLHQGAKRAVLATPRDLRGAADGLGEGPVPGPRARAAISAREADVVDGRAENLANRLEAHAADGGELSRGQGGSPGPAAPDLGHPRTRSTRQPGSGLIIGHRAPLSAPAPPGPTIPGMLTPACQAGLLSGFRPVSGQAQAGVGAGSGRRGGRLRPAWGQAQAGVQVGYWVDSPSGAPPSWVRFRPGSRGGPGRGRPDPRSHPARAGPYRDIPDRARSRGASGSTTRLGHRPCALDFQNMTTLLQPGRLSPMRQVPASIPRPEYVGRKNPRPGEPDVKDAETIEGMRAAAKLAAQALAEVGKHVAPGGTTDALDRVGHEFLCDHGAYPSTLGYRGYPKSLCTSLNEVICHGIPDDTVIADGDIVNIDITGFIGGVHGDTNATFLAGAVDEESRLLVKRTHEAMMRGIRAVAPGRPLNAIGRVIESYARRFGYGVVRDFTGHGIGTTFHSGLMVPHFDDPDVSVIMEAGMTFTIEPMLTLGTISYDIWPDGWTAVTTDRKRTAQFED